MAASSSDRPTRFVTASVAMGCTAHSGGGEEGGPRAAEESRRQQEEQPHVDQNGQNIHGVIAGCVLAIPQDRVVEEKCGGGQGAIEAGMKVRPPVILIRICRRLAVATLSTRGSLRMMNDESRVKPVAKESNKPAR